MSHSQHRLRPRIRARMRRPTPDPDPCQVVVTVLGWRSSRYLLACVAPVPCARRRCALMYALARTPTPARPCPHAHARTPTPVTNRLPLYLPNCSRLPHRTPDRLLKRLDSNVRLRFVCAGWHAFATYRSANVAARPFGSQLGKCFDNRSASTIASIVCLELIGYCLWLWLNQSGVFAVCLTSAIF